MSKQAAKSLSASRVRKQNQYKYTEAPPSTTSIPNTGIDVYNQSIILLELPTGDNQASINMFNLMLVKKLYVFKS